MIVSNQSNLKFSKYFDGEYPIVDDVLFFNFVKIFVLDANRHLLKIKNTLKEYLKRLKIMVFQIDKLQSISIFNLV